MAVRNQGETKPKKLFVTPGAGIIATELTTPAAPANASEEPQAQEPQAPKWFENLSGRSQKKVRDLLFTQFGEKRFVSVEDFKLMYAKELAELKKEERNFQDFEFTSDKASEFKGWYDHLSNQWFARGEKVEVWRSAESEEVWTMCTVVDIILDENGVRYTVQWTPSNKEEFVKKDVQPEFLRPSEEEARVSDLKRNSMERFIFAHDQKEAVKKAEGNLTSRIVPKERPAKLALPNLSYKSLSPIDRLKQHKSAKDMPQENIWTMETLEKIPQQPGEDPEPVMVAVGFPDPVAVNENYVKGLRVLLEQLREKKRGVFFVVQMKDKHKVAFCCDGHRVVMAACEQLDSDTAKMQIKQLDYLLKLQKIPAFERSKAYFELWGQFDKALQTGEKVTAWRDIQLTHQLIPFSNADDGGKEGK